MSREQYIKEKIRKKGNTIKSFAKEINMPYSTLLSMLNTSIGSSSVDNAIKICQGLGISINELQESEDIPPQPEFPLSDAEKKLILQYRLHPEYHLSIEKLLDLNA